MMLGLSLTAGAAAASQKTQIDELIRLSGIERQLAQLPALMQQQMARQKRNIPPELAESMVKALIAAYQPAALLATVREMSKLAYDPNNMSGTLAWLKGPIGMRMTQMEIDSSTVAGQQAKAAYAKSWETKPPSQERIQLMLQFNEASRATLFTIQMVVASFDGMMRGMMAMMPEEKRITDKQLTDIKNKMMQQLAQPLLNQNVVGFMYTYREVSAGDMGRAIAFYQSEDGKWYQHLMMSGLLMGMEEGGVRFGQKIESIVKNAPQSS